MADLINFVSKREIDAKKEEKKKAREQILKKAKEDYEREQRRKERHIESGESSWMLPSLSERLTAEDDNNDKDKSKKKKHKKEKKQKKDKKERKHKKQKKDVTGEHFSSESGSDDDWVEKGTCAPPTTDAMNCAPPTTDAMKSPSKPSQLQQQQLQQQQQQQQQRDSWMLRPPISLSSPEPMTVVEEEPDQEESKEENDKSLSCMDRPGQHAKELNPYWRDGGTGLPSQRDRSQETTHMEENPRSSFSSAWLKKAYQRAKDQAAEEGKRLADVVAKRYGSVEILESMIKEAEEREAKLKREESGREKYRGDKDNRNDRRRDRDEGRNRERSPDRHKTGTYRSARDTEEEKWRRRPERDDGGKERLKNDTTRFVRPTDSDNRSSFAGKFKRPPTSTTASVKTSTWNFDSKEESRSRERHEEERPSSRPSSGWRKKQETGTGNGSSSHEVQHTEDTAQEMKSESERDSSSSSEGEAEEKRTVVIPAKKVTEKDLNDIGAKIVKAEIMGNEELAIKLKSQLEEMRKNKELQEAAVKKSGTADKHTEEMVILTRTDTAGNVWPLEMTERQEPTRGRKKRKKVETHGKQGTRERYFADDDRYDLKEMVRREKMCTTEDNAAMMSKLASKATKNAYSDDFMLDDHFVSSAANEISPAQMEQREKQKAVQAHRLLAAQLAKCRFCFENPDIAKHLIIAIGLKVYLAVPLHESLTEGHCLIIPMQHCSASTLLDEDVWSEVQIYKKGLTKMFEEMEEDVVFLETYKQLQKQHHMIIECVPLPKEIGEMSPVYFKKAILESDTEWAQNKKLIDTRQKGLRAAIPKGLPYFSVEFGLDGGFAHVIEDEELFPHYFGKEIVGGMLDLEPRRWRKPRRENFEEHKRKVLRFADWWKPYDWTRRIESN